MKGLKGLHIGIYILFFILILSTVSYAAYITIGGDPNPLEVKTDSDGKVQIYHQAYTRGNYYSDTSSGLVFHYDEDSSRYTYSSPYFGQTSLTQVSHQNTSSNILETILKTTHAQINQTVKYINWEQKVSYRWNITNTGSNPLTNVYFGRGGDTYFADSDSAQSYRSESLDMIYLKNANAQNSGIMGFSGTIESPLSGYFGGRYSTGKSWLSAETKTNTVDSSFVDAGYYVYWLNASIAPGESWIITAEEQITAGGNIQVISPSSRSLTFTGNTTINYVFNLLNFEENPSTFTLTATSSSGWQTQLNQTTIDLASTANGAVTVTLHIPGNVSINTVDILTFNATSATTGDSSANLVTTTVSLPPSPQVLIKHVGSNTTVSESGLTDIYAIELNREPKANLTVYISPDVTQILTNVTNLTFTNTTWNLSQYVNVSAINDVKYERLHSANITHTFNTTDPAFYENGTITNISIFIEDDDNLSQILSQNYSGLLKYNTNVTFIANFTNPQYNISNISLETDVSGLNYTYTQNVTGMQALVSFTKTINEFYNTTVGYRWIATDIYNNTNISAWYTFKVANTLPILTKTNFIVLTNESFSSTVLCTDIDSFPLEFGVNDSLWSFTSNTLSTTVNETHVGNGTLNITCYDQSDTVSKVMNYSIFDRTPPRLLNVTLSNTLVSHLNSSTEITVTLAEYSLSNITLNDILVNNVSLTSKQNITGTQMGCTLNNTCQINITATDLFGNQNSTLLAFNIDQTIPNITLLSPRNGATLHELGGNFSYIFVDAFSPNATCSIYVVNVSKNTTLAQNNSLVDVYVTNVTEGFKNWYVECTDAMSNFARSNNYSILIPIENTTGTYEFNASRNVEINRSTIKAVIKTNYSGNSAINFSRYSVNPGNITPTQKSGFADATLDSYVVIEAETNLTDVLEWAWIQVDYNQTYIDEKNLIESSLAIFYFNTTNSKWQREEKTGVNITANYVWANISHFSLYAPGGNYRVAEIQTTEDSSANNGPKRYDMTKYINKEKIYSNPYVRVNDELLYKTESGDSYIVRVIDYDKNHLVLQDRITNEKITSGLLDMGFLAKFSIKSTSKGYVSIIITDMNVTKIKANTIQENTNEYLIEPSTEFPSQNESFKKISPRNSSDTLLDLIEVVQVPVSKDPDFGHSTFFAIFILLVSFTLLFFLTKNITDPKQSEFEKYYANYKRRKLKSLQSTLLYKEDSLTSKPLTGVSSKRSLTKKRSSSKKSISSKIPSPRLKKGSAGVLKKSVTKTSSKKKSVTRKNKIKKKPLAKNRSSSNKASKKLPSSKKSRYSKR